ncbi:MAG TPA: hypothetical protein ENJ95_00735 [Bacteroidetes bacterium]|nr:hypothetical protein [Bacteroidota bacterium]
MANIYVNENFPLPVVTMLRNEGHDVLTSLDAGNANKRIPDDKVLEFAINNKRIMLTLNRRDFIHLHKKAAPQHFGIIVCTEDADFEALAGRILKVLLEHGDDVQNMLIRIYRPA